MNVKVNELMTDRLQTKGLNAGLGGRFIGIREIAFVRGEGCDGESRAGY